MIDDLNSRLDTYLRDNDKPRKHELAEVLECSTQTLRNVCKGYYKPNKAYTDIIHNRDFQSVRDAYNGIDRSVRESERTRLIGQALTIKKGAKNE